MSQDSLENACHARPKPLSGENDSQGGISTNKQTTAANIPNCVFQANSLMVFNVSVHCVVVQEGSTDKVYVSRGKHGFSVDVPVGEPLG